MDEGRKEHLQMIQRIIDRMAENSFQLKGWTVTLAAALKVFLKGEARPAWLFVPSLPVIAFWLLDLRSRANKTRGAGFSPFAGEVGQR